MPILRFEVNTGEKREVQVTTLLNGGYAGRSQDDVRAHVEELAELGVPAPTTTPTLYPVAPYLAQQADEVAVQHDRTSGEAEWAIVVTGPEPEDVLITVACDHTDRALEVHGVAWSKNAGPDVLGTRAWRLTDVADRLDALTLTAWVGEHEPDTLLQSGTLGELLAPAYWIEVLRERDLLRPGTVLLSGTIPMREGVNQFAGAWKAELADPETGDALTLAYRVRRLPEPIE
ncbi:DUF2848 domain-containing protein [Marinactinospora rubrisoli]|uniref:DUF2848 domain-containing protein n=1 Tax=Marinactinospora rubrisoli TaxID=2715399 RepID=A0ABW2KDH6_9ACTN